MSWRNSLQHELLQRWIRVLSQVFILSEDRFSKHQSAAVITFNRCLGEYKIESEDLVGLCHNY